MPIPNPVLDDRSFEQLYGELVRRIPVYTPEWTDINESDPGVTFLQLFAFLGENLLFRFNQIPEATRLAFLRLLDVPLRPANAAEALVSLAHRSVPRSPAAYSVLVPSGTELSAGSVSFSTTAEVNVLPLRVIGVVKAPSPAPTSQEQQDWVTRSVDLAGASRPVHYSAVAIDADPASPSAVAHRIGDAVDEALWLALVSTAPEIADVGSVLLEPGARRDAPRRLLSVGVLFDDVVEDPTQVEVRPAEGDEPSSPPVEWSVSQALPVVPGREPAFLPVAVLDDGTAGLTRTGVVRLELPATDVGLFEVGDPAQVGVGALPPELPAEADGTLLCWLRARRAASTPRANAPTPPIGPVSWVGANVAPVAQYREAAPEMLGVGTGDADQIYPLVHANAIGPVAVDVEERRDDWQPWRQVDSFVASGPADRVYTVDRESGRVTFGSGLRGFPPQLGQRIRARGYRFGGGAAGNVGPGAISRVVGLDGLSASNPLHALGGVDAEEPVAALDRIPGELRRRFRAVTRSDFAELALETVGVARAECLPLFDASQPETRAPGVVSVVIWPVPDLGGSGAPRPRQTLLDTVGRYLDARRLVTTELYVIPPLYRPIAVSVGVSVKDGFDLEGVRDWVSQILRQYLSPLPPFGPEGGGWPLGRTVRRPELEAVAIQVEGVDYLEGMRLAERRRTGDGWEELADPAVVVLGPNEVPELVELTVVSGPPLPPGVPAGAGSGAGGPGGGDGGGDGEGGAGGGGEAGTPIPVPVLKEQC